MNDDDLDRALEEHLGSAGTTVRRDGFEEMCVRLADATIGYAISSLAALTILWVPVRAFLVIHEVLQRHGHGQGALATAQLILGSSGLLVWMIALGFFVGGWALCVGQRWGRFLLQYTFILWGLVLLFEVEFWVRRAGFFLPDRGGVVNIGLIVLALVCVRALHKAYRRQSPGTIRAFAILGGVTTVVNLIFIAGYFIALDPSSMSDRHLHYLPLFFMAAVIQQASTVGRDLLPTLIAARDGTPNGAE